MTSSNGNNIRVLAPCQENPSVTGGFPSQMPVTRSFDVFFDLGLNKRLSKQWRRTWFRPPSRSLWRYCYSLRSSAYNIITKDVQHRSIPNTDNNTQQNENRVHIPWAVLQFGRLSNPIYYSEGIMRSIASWLFTQLIVYSRIKINIKAPRHWPLWGEPPVTGRFPSQRTSNAEMFSFDDVIMQFQWMHSWHHDKYPRVVTSV